MNIFYKILGIAIGILALYCFYLQAVNSKLQRIHEKEIRKELVDRMRSSDSIRDLRYDAKVNYINSKVNYFMDSVSSWKEQIIKSKISIKQSDNEIDHLYLIRDTIHMHPDSLKRF